MVKFSYFLHLRMEKNKIYIYNSGPFSMLYLCIPINNFKTCFMKKINIQMVRGKYLKYNKNKMENII